MPVYEYQCDHCGHAFDALRRMAEADQPIACTKCGKTQSRRLHSVFAAGGAEGRGTSLPVGGGCACGKPHGSCSR